METGIEGTVRELLPQGLFRVELDDRRVVQASISVEARRVLVSVKPGDRVRVRLHELDESKAVIEDRLSSLVSRKRS